MDSKRKTIAGTQRVPDPEGVALRLLAVISIMAAVLLGVYATTAEASDIGSPAADQPAETELPNGETLETEQPAAKDGFSRRDALLASLTIFVLAIFVGFEVISKVPTTLHTPLMSGSNAISGITLVGAVLAAGSSGALVAVFGMLAVVMATVNVVGGFLVTHRMLSMFRKR